MAKAQIDIYRDWLEITETARPLNYYQLLKLPQFEDDRNKIRKQYRQLNAHIRKYATGEYIDESQNLLNELAKAMLCLTDAARKEEYDHSLGREATATSRRLSLGDILVRGKIISPDQLKKAQGYSDAVGVELPQAVLQHKFAAPEIVMLAYAESIGLPFIDLNDLGVETEYAPMINPNTARQNSFVPVMVDQGNLIVASPTPVNPDVEEELRILLDMPVRCAICTPAQVNEAIAKYYPRDAVQMIPKKGSAKEASAKAKQEKSKKPAKPKKEKPVADEDDIELDEDAKKNRLMYTAIALFFGVMVAAIILQFSMRWNFSDGFHLVKFFGISFVVGLISGGVTWVVTGKK